MSQEQQLHVAFDIGNVLAEIDLSKFTNKLKEFIPPHEDPMFFLDNLQAMQDLGLTTIRQSLRHHHNINEPEAIEILIHAWNDIVKPNEMMLNFMDNLRSEGVKIALLSNIGSEHAEFLKRTCSKMFAGCVEHLSYEVGARKPSKIYYQSFLMDHAEWVGAIYLDDRPENLKVGKQYSFKSFKFCLDEVLTWPLSKQRRELEKVHSYIFNRKYDSLPHDI